MNSGTILKGLRIEDLSRGGLGVAREAGPDLQDNTASSPVLEKKRRVIFVPFTLPGDVVTARIISEEKRFAEAEVLEFEKHSPDRATPPCKVFGECGGCTWQHVPYALQWKTKRDGVLHALSRTGVKLPETVIEEFPAEHPWNYRNRIQLRARTSNGETTLGFFGRRSRYLVSIDRCEIAREELNAVLAETLEEAKAKNAPETKVELEVLPDGSVRKAWNSRHGSMGFRQVNDEQNEKLRNFVREALTPGAHLFDLFGGAGNFSYDDAKRYAWVECVDFGSPEGGFEGQPENYRFFKSDVGRWLQRREKDLESGHFKPKGPLEIVLDPPREGLGDQSNKIAGALEALGAKKIVAIGCDPDSWARDLSRLEKYGWRLERFAAFDLFPQTPHIESVGVLVRG